MDEPLSLSHKSNIRLPAALIQRPDLLAQEAQIVSESRRNWRGRLHDLGDYGTTGGSAADRRSIVEYMAAIEEQQR